MEALYTSIVEKLTLNNLYEFLTFIVPVIATYIITRYSTNHPKKIAIKEKQFLNVYLPLYKSLCISDKELTHETLIRYNRKLFSVLQSNYELAFPQLHTLSNQLTDSLKIHDIKNSIIIFEKIRYQISIDYEMLKRDLGYPTQNVFSILKRMNTRDKAYYISNNLAFPLLIAVFVVPLLISKIMNLGNSDEFMLSFICIVIFTINLIVFAKSSTK